MRLYQGEGGGRESDNSELRILLDKDYDFRQLPIFPICPYPRRAREGEREGGERERQNSNSKL